MNLVTTYIEEIHSVKRGCDSAIGDYVIVDMTTDCYGNIQRKECCFPKREWEKIKAEGKFDS